MVVSDDLEMIGIVAIAIALGVIARFGRRKKIVEARFDSETGKQIK